MKSFIFSAHFFSDNAYNKISQFSVFDKLSGTKKSKHQPSPTKIWCRTRCNIIMECSLTEINLRRANGQSPPLESALTDWYSILSGTEQSWNNYSNLRVEWWSSMWSGAKVSGAQYWSACHNKERQEGKAHFVEAYDEMYSLLQVLTENTGYDWNVCSYQNFCLQ